MTRQLLLCVLFSWLNFARSLQAQVTYSGTTVADAFLATGAPGNPEGSDLTHWNFGGAGTLVVGSAASPKGEFQSVLRFELQDAIALFDGTFGVGHWTISSADLQLTSNYGTPGAQPNNPIFPVVNGGKFVIERISDSAWAEGTGTPNLRTMDGVTYAFLPELLAGSHENLGTNVYAPPGDNVPVQWSLPLTTNLLQDFANGGSVSFRCFAVDDQVGYLFNSRNYGRGDGPLLRLTAFPRLQILSLIWTNGALQLSGLAATNGLYRLQASADLSPGHWQTLGSAVTDDSGLWHFDDSSAASHSRRFYRLAQ